MKECGPLQKVGGVIDKIIEDAKYPIFVLLNEGGSEYFTIRGLRLEGDIKPSLFWDEFSFEIPKKPRPNLEVDTKVFVWDGTKAKKCKRHFKEWSELGRMITFIDGLSSWTSGKEPRDSIWDNWELVDV